MHRFVPVPFPKNFLVYIKLRFKILKNYSEKILLIETFGIDWSSKKGTID